MSLIPNSADVSQVPSPHFFRAGHVVFSSATFNRSNGDRVAKIARRGRALPRTTSNLREKYAYFSPQDSPGERT